jgi:hypothetical protein
MYYIIKNDLRNFNKYGIVRFIGSSTDNLYYEVEDAYDKDIISWYMYEDLLPSLYEIDKLSPSVENQLIGKELMDMIN